MPDSRSATDVHLTDRSLFDEPSCEAARRGAAQIPHRQTIERLNVVHVELVVQGLEVQIGSF